MTVPDRFYRALEPEELGAPRGYSHGLLAPSTGRLVFVAGQTAVDSDESLADAGFADQFEVALRRVIRVVDEAGGNPRHIGRMTVYVTDLEAYRACRRELGVRWRSLMGRHYPAMSLVAVAALLEEGALVEIEATAVVPAGSPDG